jgi:ABC-type transport system substrate-binding protein
VPGSYSNSGGILVRRNTNYYRTTESGEPLPYLEEVEAVRISDRLTRRVAFLDKQIHTYDAEGREEVEELEGQVRELQVVEDPSTTFVSFVMNPTRPPWNDDLIRKAALHALDRQEFVDRIVGPDGGQPDGLVHWPLGDFALPPEELQDLQSFDPDESRRLIRAATGEETIDIDVIYPVTDDEFHDKHVPIFLQQMKAAGFEVRQDPRDIAGWLADYQSLNYDASLSINQEYETAEMPIDFHAAAGPQGDGNFATGVGALYPDVEEAIQASKRVTDPAQQIEAVRDVQRLIYEKGPASLPIMSWMSFELYHGFVKNVPRSLGTTELFLTNEIWLDEEA